MKKKTRKRATATLLTLLSLATGPALLTAAEVATGQHAKHFEKKTGDATVGYEYLLFLPADYGKDPAKRWPLMLFLHGSGERGTDINLVKKHGPPKIVEHEPDFPFIVVSPQCPSDVWWQPAALSALLDDVIANYQVDPDRVYLTGLSMGGFGAWALAAQEPSRFAAIVPICGGGDPRSAEKLKDLPIWVFHGEMDSSVPIQRSQEMVDALKAVGNDVKFTHYPDAGHDCWTRTYDNPQLYEWLLAHPRNPEKSPPTAVKK